MLSHSQLRALSTVAIVALVTAILIVTLTPLGTSEEPGDNCSFGLPCVIGHVALFGALGVGIAGRFATSDAARRSPRRVLLMTLLAVWVFAAADELAQEWWVDGRGGQLTDWLADMAGVLAGIPAGGFLLRRVVRAGH